MCYILNSLYRDGMVEALEPELVHNYPVRFRSLADIYSEQWTMKEQINRAAEFASKVVQKNFQNT